MLHVYMYLIKYIYNLKLKFRHRFCSCFCGFLKVFLIDTIEQSFEKEMIQVTYFSTYCIQIRTYLLHVHFNILFFFFFGKEFKFIENAVQNYAFLLYILKFFKK